jgi:hypothetical protein
VVDSVLEKYSKPDGNSKVLGDKITGRLLHAQMEHNPDHEILSHIKRAIHNLPKYSSQSSQVNLRIQHDICEAAAPQIGWTTERDSKGIRQITFRTSPRLLRDDYDAKVARKTAVSTFQDQFNQTELSIAIIANAVAKVKNLIESGAAKLDFESICFGLPIALAAAYQRVEIINYLLSQCVKWRTTDALWSKTANHLITLLKLHITSQIKLALEPTIASLDLAVHELDLLLRKAASSGSALIFTHLLSARSLETPSLSSLPATQQLLIHKATTSGNVATLKIMLEKGFKADENPRYLPSQTPPLQTAARHGRAEIAALLLKYSSADNEEEDLARKVIWTNAWNEASKGGYDEVLSVLLDDAEKGKSFKTIAEAFSWVESITIQHAHVLRMLIPRGLALHKISPHKTWSLGLSTMNSAIFRGDLSCVEALVEAGVTINDEDKTWDAVYNAKVAGEKLIYKFLRRNGGMDNHCLAQSIEVDEEGFGCSAAEKRVLAYAKEIWGEGRY